MNTCNNCLTEYKENKNIGLSFMGGKQIICIKCYNKGVSTLKEVQ